MPDCGLIEKCLFFNDKMENKPALTEMYKQKYCKGDYPACARYVVVEALGREKVPPNLFPNQADTAKRIISAGG